MSQIKRSEKTLTVGIVGGGRAGLSLYTFFVGVDCATVAYLVDPNPDAPGIQAAKAAKIMTFRDIEDAIRSVDVDVVLEVTGLPEVAGKLQERLQGTSTHVVDSTVARLMAAVNQENSSKLRGELSQSLNAIKGEIANSLSGSKNLVGRINQIMSSIQMLALNASIEAAKVGVHGKGFAVVADHMTKSVESVRNLTQEIEKVNSEIQQVANQIDTALARLK